MAERSAASRLAASGRGRADETAQTAGLGPRLLAYLLDSVICFGFTMVFATIGGLVIFVSSGGGDRNPSDAAFSALVIVVLATVPAWLLFVAGMYLRRGQSPGQYVTGIEITRDDGGVVSSAQVIAYCLVLHPLVYHPILAGVWAYASYQSVMHSSLILLLGGITMTVLCIAAPLVSLLFVLTDGRRRGIHDRIAGVRVVKVLDQA